MAKFGQEVLCEGWLTKSPPTKRVWRARWRRRWFSLTQSGEIPGQYILTYYADRNCRKLKGVIELDRCEQVDLGLKLEERKLRFDHVFDIKTPTRTYFLAADTENDMRCWVKNICKVCGLKATAEEDEYYVTGSNPSGVEIVEEECDDSNYNKSIPISPVSTSPYIPISECFTGKSPVLDPKDIQSFLAYNSKHYFPEKSSNFHSNETYEQSQRDYYNMEMDPRFYDCPRKLAPPQLLNNTSTTGGINKEDNDNNVANKNEKNSSPLQSPTDSESVFTDDDWVHNTSIDSVRTQRPSDSSDVDIVATQRFTKNGGQKEIVPPRPPKPVHIVTPGSYLNLGPLNKSKESEDNELTKSGNETTITDDMYDFPRSHVVNDTSTSKRRHCYNNAAPANVEGSVFTYDGSPKPCSSNFGQVFKYDGDIIQDEPASPHSQTSSKSGYSNLPSPLLLSESQLMPPPIVNRDLKPKRKLSDSHSIGSNPEPPSPRGAPSVDRKLKPPTPLQEAHGRKHFSGIEDRKIRVGPPSPLNIDHRSQESLLSVEEIQCLSSGMQYLDLDLDGVTSSTTISSANNTIPKSAGENYKQIDFIKTHAFNVTRNNLEKERQEPVKSIKK